jgi:hypothetical protein
MTVEFSGDGREDYPGFDLPPGTEHLTSGNGSDTDFVEVPTTGRSHFAAPVFPDAAMPGVWGQLVREWEPWTEAHPASIVIPALIMLGVHGGEGVRLGRQRTIEYLGVS